MVRVLVIGFAKIFEVAIITSSFCFAGIICHSIILRYLLTVLRLLCALCNSCNIGRVICLISMPKARGP